MSRETWIFIGIALALVAVVTLVFAVKMVLRLLAAKRTLGELGAGGKVAFYGAMIYTIFPVDLLPDPIYLDDIGVLMAATAYLTKLARDRRGAYSPNVRQNQR